MRNRFNLNESEKNRIRGLHGIKVLNEVTELDMGLSDVSKNESDWEKDNWDELDDKQKELYRTHHVFKDLGEDEVKEKYNNMEKGPLRDIIKNVFSWFRGLFKKDEDEYVGTPLPETSPFKKIEGDIFVGVGKASLFELAKRTSKADAAAKIWNAASLTGTVNINSIPMLEVEGRTSKERRNSTIKNKDGMYTHTSYYEIK